MIIVVPSKVDRGKHYCHCTTTKIIFFATSPNRTKMVLYSSTTGKSGRRIVLTETSQRITSREGSANERSREGDQRAKLGMAKCCQWRRKEVLSQPKWTQVAAVLGYSARRTNNWQQRTASEKWTKRQRQTQRGSKQQTPHLWSRFLFSFPLPHFFCCVFVNTTTSFSGKKSWRTQIKSQVFNCWEGKSIIV